MLLCFSWRTLSASNPWLPLLTFIACLVVMHFSQNVWALLACYPLFAVLVASSATQKHPQHIANRVLDNRLTNWLGDLSYSMYLWHCVLLLAGVEILNLINSLAVDKWYQQTSWLAHLLAISGFLGLLIALSALSYYGFEKPIMKWLRRQPAAQMQAETKRT
ncbi:hypothetical protein JCM19238_542 [Vibrio ponticus]|nr:hypothetical protein JCM19238_542 [Vibrio ponticus]